MKEGKFVGDISADLAYDEDLPRYNPDIVFSYKNGHETEYVIWEITVTMDNSLQDAKHQKLEKYQRLIDAMALQSGRTIGFEVMVFGVLGGIPRNFETILKRVTTKSKTDWLVDEIQKALMYHNHALWCRRDRLVRAIQ